MDLSPERRDEFLAAACPDDDELRGEVRKLLAAHDAVIAQGGTRERFLEQLDAARAAALIEPTGVADLQERLQSALGSAYRIDRELGGGGMSRVFVAHDQQLGRPVVVKVLPPELAAGLNAERFRREIQLAARLQHPHIVPLLAAGTPGGMLYYTMPLVEGESLRTRLAREGRLAIREAARVLRDLADALACAHAHGVVHRDIKPDNVLLSGQHALVTDFGVARAVTRATEGEAAAALTSGGVALGTPAYMAPEQVAADPGVDHRADLYSLGALGYELLAGRPPFVGSTPREVLAAHIAATPDPVTKHRDAVPPELARLIMRCLEKDPAARWQTADELLVQLEVLAGPNAKDLIAELDALRVSAGTGVRSSERSRWRSAARRWRTWHAGAALLLMVSVLTILLWSRPGRRNPRRVPVVDMQSRLPSIAVLPLKNYSGDPAQDYFADGMTDELTTTLAKIAALRVIAHQSVLQFKHSRQSVPEIARLLKVQHIVDGSVLQHGDRVRITATLIDAARNTPVWVERFERERRDVMALQRDVALAIARAIETALTPQDLARLDDTSPVDPEAFDLYVKGTQARYRSLENQDIAEALRYFARAIAKDSNYAPAHAGLASAYVFSGDEARARRFVERALALDPRLAEAHVVLGLIRQAYDWDWAGSEESFRQAIRLNPGFAEAHHELSMLLMRRRRFDEALHEAQRTRYLAPMSSRFEHGLAEIHLMSGRYDEALRGSDRVLTLDSTQVNAYWLRAIAYEQQRHYDEAEKAWSKFLALGGDVDMVRGGLGRIYTVSGRRVGALRILDTLRNRWAEQEGRLMSYGAALAIAEIYTALGDRERALDWLERAAGSGAFMLYLAIDPQLRPLHGEPRFQALLKKVGLAL